MAPTFQGSVCGTTNPLVAGSAPLTLLVQTGPWTRRLRLSPVASADDATHPQAAPPFSQLVALGALHLDRECGQVLDDASLEKLTASEALRIHGEILTIDVARKRRAFVGEDTVSPSLEEVTAESLQWIAARPQLHWLAQVSGRQLMDGFGIL